MSIAWTRILDQHIAAPRPSRNAARERDGSAAVLPPRRGGLSTPRRVFLPGAGWLGGWRSGRFAGRVSLPPSRRARPALIFQAFRGSAGSYSLRQPADPRMPSMRDGLHALARVNAAVLAGQLVADRSRSQGGLRSI